MVSNKANENNKRGFSQMANRQRFKPGGIGKQGNHMNNIRNMGAMFNANQLGDNPGFMDFNDDSITSTLNGTGVGGGGSGSNNNANTAPEVGNKNLNGARRLNPNMKRPIKNGAPGMRHRMNGMHSWGPPMPAPNMFPVPPAPGRRGPMNPPPVPPPPAPYHNAHGGGMRMRGPQNGRFGAGGPPGPMSLLSMNRPIPPPLPPIGRPMPPPHAMGRMMPPPMRLEGPVRRNMNGNMHGRPMNAFPRNAPPTNGAATASNGKRNRPKHAQNREEYPLDKPWVTEEIKAEHDKKTDLANRLKGRRDDALFAQFKEQRDKFVKMYESARAEFANKNPEQDVAKSVTESSSTCKKARIETVEKVNGGTVSAEIDSKADEASTSTLISAVAPDDSIKAIDATDEPSAAESGSESSVESSTSSTAVAASAGISSNDSSATDTPVLSSTPAKTDPTLEESPEAVTVTAEQPSVAANESCDEAATTGS